MGTPVARPRRQRAQTGRRSKSRWRVWMVFSAICLWSWSPAAFPYRPFDQTDADVADEGEFELELGPVGYVREGSDKFLIAPALVGNLGIAQGREIVLEGKLSTPVNGTSGSQTSLEDVALSLKQVHRQGSLQDGSGVSVASECGVLLPGIHAESGTGARCTGIVSQRWPEATIHLNAGLAFDREHNWNRIFGGILEGPHEWTVRPALELIAERNNNGSSTNSALAALIWRKQENLSFDLGVRAARTDDQDVYEIRAGLTWGFSVGKGK